MSGWMNRVKRGRRRGPSKPYLCSQRHVELMGQRGPRVAAGHGLGQAERGSSAWTEAGRRTHAGGGKKDFLPEVPEGLRVCCKARGHEKWRRVVLPGRGGDEGELMPSVSLSSSTLSFAAETTLFKFVVLNSFNKTSTSGTV